MARRSWSDRALAIESIAMLAAARALVITGREKNLVSRLGGATPVTQPESVSQEGTNNSTAGHIGAMVERVAPHTWWRSMCLEKALAAKWMLRRRGIPGTMYVGMAKEGDTFVAHAWLVAEGRTLTGAATKVYATLAAFREH